jgi:hypothetical protein
LTIGGAEAAGESVKPMPGSLMTQSPPSVLAYRQN